MSFRLTDNQYHRLLEACRASGSHSLSDFARLAVQQHSTVSLNGDVEGSIAHLQEQVDEFRHVLERIFRLAKPKKK